MLESSTDILWLVLAFVILWIGIFLGWGAFYLAMMLRDIQHITRSVRRKVNLIEQILDAVKKRVEITADYLPPLIEGASKLVEHFKEKSKVKSKK